MSEWEYVPTLAEEVAELDPQADGPAARCSIRHRVQQESIMVALQCRGTQDSADSIGTWLCAVIPKSPSCIGQAQIPVSCIASQGWLQAISLEKVLRDL